MAKAKQERKGKPSPSAGVCGLLVRIPAVSVSDAELKLLVTACFPQPIVRTLQEVGAAFGVQASTLRANWRTQGMPGESNRWDLREVAIWRRGHLADLEKRADDRTPSDSFTRRKNEAEARKVELEVEKREQEMALSSGRLVDRSVIVPAIRALLSKAAEWLSTVGDEIEPELPVEIAKEKAARINDLNARALQAVAEMAARDIAALVPNA